MDAIALLMSAQPAMPVPRGDSTASDAGLFDTLVTTATGDEEQATPDISADTTSDAASPSDLISAIVSQWVTQTHNSASPLAAAGEGDAVPPEIAASPAADPAEGLAEEHSNTPVLAPEDLLATDAGDQAPEAGKLPDHADKVSSAAQSPDAVGFDGAPKKLDLAVVSPRARAEEPKLPIQQLLQYADGIGWSVSPPEPSRISGATIATPNDPTKDAVVENPASILVTRANAALSRQTGDPSADDSKSADSFAATTLDDAKPSNSDPATTAKTPDRRPPEQTNTHHAALRAEDPLPHLAPNAQANTASAPSPSADSISIPPAANASATAESSADTPVRLSVATREGQTAEMQTLALHIAARSAKGDSRFTIRLDPPELGQIDVNLSVNSHGHAQAVLAVEKPQTLDLLQRDAPALERALKDAGLELGSNLSFSLKDEGRQNFAREDQYPPPGRTLELVPTGSAAPHPALSTSLVEQLYGLRTARLDIRV